MKKKNFTGVKFESEQGRFRAIFSTFNVRDLDGDVTMPDAFIKNQPVRISYWGHRWGELPVGRGIIDFDGEKAWVDGQFFLDTDGGIQTYKTVKALDDLQEWSYGFHVLEQESGTKDGESVNFLKKLDVFEVSPVLLGAGIDTRTEAIKSSSEDVKVLCMIGDCAKEASLLIDVCDNHGFTDVVSFAGVLKQALAECDEEVIKALIKELTPKLPVPKGPMKHQLLAELSAARANSASIGGLRS